MTRRSASWLLFFAACLLMGGAALMLLTAWLVPYQGLEGLGRVVGAMLLAALAVVPFVLAVLVGRGTGMPRWVIAGSLVGAAMGAVPAVALLSARFAS